MPYMYCHECDGEVREPSSYEVCQQRHDCPHCGCPLPITKTLGELVLELIERIEQLESEKIPPLPADDCRAPSISSTVSASNTSLSVAA